MITILLINLFIISAGCGLLSNNDNDKLPSTRPDKLQISYSVSGGMMNYSERCFISADSCWYKYHYGEADSKINFKLTNEELDNLYKVFVDNKFYKISTREEMVYDRGGTSMSVNWADGKRASVSNSGMSFVDKSWSSEWNACGNAIEKIIKEQKEKNSNDFIIHLDSSMYNNEVYVQLNFDALFPKANLFSKDNSPSVPVKTKLMPGSHSLSVTCGKLSKRFNVSADNANSCTITSNGTILLLTYNR